MLDKKKYAKIIAFLNVKIKKKTKKKNLKNFNFLKSEEMDSLDILNFIIFIEKKYKIKFKEEDYKNNNFGLIGGLAKIIYKKIWPLFMTNCQKLVQIKY